MFVKPPEPRHRVLEEAGTLEIRIPAKRNLFVLGFLLLWLCGWAFGEILALVAMFTGGMKDAATAIFMCFWLTGWSVGGASAILVWLWMLRGSEVVTVSPVALGIRREIFGRGFTWHYDFAEIRKVRVQPLVFNPRSYRGFYGGLAYCGLRGGALAFDYGAKTYHFGAGLDEAEGRMVLKSMTPHLPASANA